MAFVSLTDLEDSIDFELDEQGKRQAKRRLEMASNLARYTAGIEWPDDKCPAIVRDIVLNMVERYMRNPDAYNTSRAGDETVGWADGDERGNWYLTEEEKAILTSLGKPSFGIGSISVSVWGTRPTPNTIFVHTDPVVTGDLFPLFAADDPIIQ